MAGLLSRIRLAERTNTKLAMVNHQRWKQFYMLPTNSRKLRRAQKASIVQKEGNSTLRATPTDDVEFTSYDVKYITCFCSFSGFYITCFCSQKSDDVKYITSPLKVLRKMMYFTASVGDALIMVKFWNSKLHAEETMSTSSASQRDRPCHSRPTEGHSFTARIKSMQRTHCQRRRRWTWPRRT